MKNISQNLHRYFLVFLLIISAVIWYAVSALDNHGVLTVAFLDIGQGDSIFIQAPNGNQLLLDGGPDNKVLRQIGLLMPWFDRSLDMVAVSNTDADHFGGLIYVLKSYFVPIVLEPGTNSKTEAYKVLEREIKDENIKKVTARRGMKIILDDNPVMPVYLLVLFPDRDASAMATNDGSMVAKLVYGQTSILFTGDSPKSVENYLMRLDSGILDSDVLKVGHHGSRTSTGLNYVEAISPGYAVISDAKGNSYGHPHKETLETLNSQNVKILRTDTLGTIVLKSDGRRISL